MTNIILALATGLYTGYLPKAPGTWGSALALPLHFLLTRLAPTNYFLSLGVILTLAVLSAGSAEKILDTKDPGVVVIDEVAGMLITLIGAPDNPVVWVIGFGIFRVFDIAKPFPIRFIDQRFNGGIGIVLDDVMAGIYSLIVLRILCRIFF